MSDVFISYSSKDREDAVLIKSVLEDNNISCWFAECSLKAGDEYLKMLSPEIKKCKVFVLLLSDNVNSSEWIPKELNIAITEHKAIVPLYIEECELKEDIAFCLNNIHYYCMYIDENKALNDLVEKVFQELKKEKQPITLKRVRKIRDNYDYFVFQNGVLKEYKGDYLDVEIPEGVIEIGRFSFVRKKMEHLVIPKGVKHIKESAFYGCSNLTEIVIPSSVETIGDEAFSFCSKLESVTIPDSVNEIWGSAF